MFSLMSIKNLILIGFIIQFSVCSVLAQPLAVSEEKQLKQMIENPQKYHEEVEDITKGHPSGHGLTSEMLKFYTAVAIVESYSCTVNNDPTGCEMFLESLKDPMGHVGFAAFMVSARKTTEFVMVKGKGAIPAMFAGNIGLMVGVIVQDLIIEISKDPHFMELLTIATNDKYPTLYEKLSRSNEIKNILWNKTFGSSEWRGDKTANIISLIAAVVFSSATQGMIAASSSVALKVGKQVLKRKKAIKIGFRLGKAVRIGGRLVRSVTPVGVTITGLVIFLEWANVTEKWIGHPLRERNALYHRVLAQHELEENIENSKDISKQSRNLSIKYFKERVVEMEPATKILSGFNAKIDQMSKEFYNVTKYLSWLAKGMNQKEFNDNSKQWHSTISQKDLVVDKPKMINGFFCGLKPKDAIKVQKEMAGIPIPFKEYDVSDFTEQIFKQIKTADASEANIRGIVIYPYKSFNIDGLCLEDIKKLNIDKFDSLFGVGDFEKVICPVKSLGNDKYALIKNKTTFMKCKIYQFMKRQNILKTGKLEGKDIRNDLVEGHRLAQARVLEKYEILRLSYIKRYEKRIFKTLLEHLTGQKFKILNYIYRDGDGHSTSVYYTTDINCKRKYFDLNESYPKPNFAGFDTMPDFDTNMVSKMKCEGSIPGLYEEIDYLKKLLKTVKTKDQRKELKTILENAIMQIKYAFKLKRFYETQLSQRQRVPDFELMFSEGDWVEMSKFYESFILNE